MPKEKVRTSELDLTDEEILLLSGSKRPGIVLAVAQAERRLSAVKRFPELGECLAAFVGDVISRAITVQKLGFEWRQIRYCGTCGSSAGYAKYKRSGRYHRKGDLNYDKPLFLRGVDLAAGFFRVKGHASLGCCLSCWEKVLPVLRQELAGVEAELPKEIAETRFRLVARRKCSKCDWEGREDQMGRLPTLIGCGTYPGKCPGCGAENRLGQTVVKETGEHELLAVAGAGTGAVRLDERGEAEEDNAILRERGR